VGGNCLPPQTVTECHTAVTPQPFNFAQRASALIYELARAGLLEAWVTPAILEEYADVLGEPRRIRR